MPVKWDSDKDKFILNCLLTDPTITVGNGVIDSIITSWPSDFGDVPTKKAVSEHFLKIRKQNKKFTDGNGTITPSGTPTKVTKVRNTPSKKAANATPSKKANGVKTPTSKRKRNVDLEDSDGDDSEQTIALRAELGILDGGSVQASPTKRSRASVKYEETDDDGAYNSGSDFHVESDA
ncbi:hypothetical protein AAFC00_002976 [Neodothiora populina]|uniref:Uncharacterized protein n=1 Tax=Neodothiora populina TaxID=2781224 RepID=A0ABR3P953_9PEZI